MDTEQLGDATGALALSKAKRKALIKSRNGSKGLLDAAGITVKDPQVRRMLGAPIKEQGVVALCALPPVLLYTK